MQKREGLRSFLQGVLALGECGLGILKNEKYGRIVRGDLENPSSRSYLFWRDFSNDFSHLL